MQEPPSSLRRRRKQLSPESDHPRPGASRLGEEEPKHHADGGRLRGIAPPPNWLTFLLILASRFLAVWFQIPILDCDETFNYWEPTHLLLYGRGLQTWEYSPEYGLRSYLYPLIHAVAIKTLQLLRVDFLWGKIGLFVGLRLLFAVASSYCEAEFVQSAIFRFSGPRHHSFGAKLGWVLLVFLLLSPGMWHASISFLPQTFTMYFILLCWAAWLRGHFHSAIWWMGCASLLGWPFSAILGLSSFTFDLLAKHGLSISLLRLIRTSLMSISVLVCASIVTDYFFYRRWILAVLNIALYNSAASGDASVGSAIYGVESWTFYFRNLFLNFNILLPAALVVGPLTLLGLGALSLCPPSSQVEMRGRPGRDVKRSFQGRRSETHIHRIVGAWLPFSRSAVVVCVPLFTWITIFSFMPHKEERFMFVVYPLLCLAAALPVTALAFSSLLPLRRIRNFLGVCFMAVFGALCMSRSASLITNYGAPLAVYQQLETQAHDPGSPLYRQIRAELDISEPFPEFTSVNVCVGKEWYRFPTHFFLPDICVARVSASDPLPSKAVSLSPDLIAFPFPCWRLPRPWRSGNSTTVQLNLRFLKSSFGGQLPQSYITSSAAYQSLFRPPSLELKEFKGSRLPISVTTGLIPPHMNDGNLEEPSRYVPLDRCNFIVDLDLTTSRSEIPDQWSQAFRNIQAGGWRWRVAYQAPFLDADKSPSLPRAFYFSIAKWNNSLKFAEYQLLERYRE